MAPQPRLVAVAAALRTPGLAFSVLVELVQRLDEQAQRAALLLRRIQPGLLRTVAVRLVRRNALALHPLHV